MRNEDKNEMIDILHENLCVGASAENSNSNARTPHHDRLSASL